MHRIEEIVNLARTEPTVHAYWKHLELGTMSQEQALIGMVVELTKLKNDIAEKYMNHINQCGTPRP